MPLDNTLNVSEMLRRLGVKGDSLGSAPLLEALRLTLNIGDLSQLVPPLLGPVGGCSIQSVPGAGNRNRWSLQCTSPGGLIIQTLRLFSGGSARVFVTDVPVFGAFVNATAHNYSFGQFVDSTFGVHAPGIGPLAPALALEVQDNRIPGFGIDFTNWIGPGQHFNLESQSPNLTEEVHIQWLEYPGALNPG